VFIFYGSAGALFPVFYSHFGGFMRYVSVHLKNNTEITHPSAKITIENGFVTMSRDTGEFVVPVDNVLFIFLGKEKSE